MSRSLNGNDAVRRGRSWKDEYVGSYKLSKSELAFEYLAVVLRYLLALPVALLAAIVAGWAAKAAGVVMASGIVELYESIVSIPPEQYAKNVGHLGLIAFEDTLSWSLAAFFFTLALCVVVIKMFPLRNQIQSIIVLQLVAMLWLLIMGGENTGSADYELMFVSLSGVVAVALIALKWPHSVFLSRPSPTQSSGVSNEPV